MTRVGGFFAPLFVLLFAVNDLAQAQDVFREAVAAVAEDVAASEMQCAALVGTLCPRGKSVCM